MDFEATDDGRRTRRLENKRKVVRATIELIRETGTVPPVEIVASRADVSRRSVFRFFSDLDSLLQTAMEELWQDIAHRFPFPEPQTTDLERSICDFVDHRARVYEYVTPIRVIGERKKHEIEAIERMYARRHERECANVREYFSAALPPASCSEAILDEVQVSSSWQTWHALRTDYSLSIPTAKARVEHIIYSILTTRGRA
ncbi:MAG: TetR/AcrR family transcriptional regulator [Spirochaetaceae bacterium]|nr:MAG: TetR/AcrR family transcriptional regulator [Spirochaetaceae bacterium]